jgi:hypothetical protein
MDADAQDVPGRQVTVDIVAVKALLLAARTVLRNNSKVVLAMTRML